MAVLNKILIVGVFLYVQNELILGGSTSNDIETCASLCKQTFQDVEQELCTRGCRLMSVLGYFHGPLMSMTELKESCLGACAEAYANTNASACAFGCHSQLPILEMQRDQLAQLERFDEDGIFALSRRFTEYSNRMMNCMLDHINHQVAVGWISITSYVSSDNGNRIVIVRGSPGQIIQPVSDSFGYVETNLAAHDGSATPMLKQSQLVRMDDRPSMSLSVGDQERTQYQSDWLSCLSAKTHLSKVSILTILFTMFLVLVWFLIGACFPATRESSNVQPKLSIYGDMDDLLVYSEKGPLFTSDRKFCVSGEAPPLPVKIREF